MTAEQFEALRQLMGWHKSSPMADACRLVLVQGMSQAQAARETGALAQHVNRSLARVRQVRSAAEQLVLPQDTTLR